MVDSLTGAPLFNATIQIEETQELFSSDLQGAFKGGYLPGTYTLHAFAPGYPPKSVSIALAEGSQEQVLIELAQVVSSTGEPGRANRRIEVAPNPIREQAEIRLVDIPEADVAVLLNAWGQEVERFSVENRTSFTIDRGIKAGGSYWLVVYGRNGEVIGRARILVR